MELLGHSFSGRDLILIGGGFFLLAKSTYEIHHKVEGDPQIHLHEAEHIGAKKRVSANMMLLQILALDIVFSLDSVITAVGMADQVSIVVVAMVIFMIIMLASAGKISTFVERHPTIKIWNFHSCYSSASCWWRKEWGPMCLKGLTSRNSRGYCSLSEFESACMNFFRGIRKYKKELATLLTDKFQILGT